MFHYSKLDMFSADIKQLADADGYIAEVNDLREDFAFPDNQYSSKDTWDDYVQQCVELTQKAHEKLNKWQSKPH